MKFISLLILMSLSLSAHAKKTREEFNLKPNDFIYVFSQYDIDFINSALLADALGLLSEEDNRRWLLQRPHS